MVHIHTLIARLLLRLQLPLAEGVEPCESDRNDDADSNRDSQQHFH
jgi:hypothetical protein